MHDSHRLADEPGCARRRRGALRLGLSALLLLLLAYQASAQESPDATLSPDVVEEPKVEPIPIEQIGVRAEKAKSRLTTFAQDVKPTEALVEVEAAIPELSTRVEQMIRESDELIESLPSTLEIDAKKLSAGALRSDLRKHQDVLSRRSTEIGEKIEAIRSMREQWTATLAVAKGEDAPIEVTRQVDEVAAAIARTSEQARARQGEIVNLQSRVARLAEAVNADIARVEQVRQELVGKIFVAGRPPIWESGTIEALGKGEIFERIVEAEKRDMQTAREFGKARKHAILLHIILLFAMIGGMFVVRARARRRSRDDADLATVSAIFERPISLSLLLIFLVMIWTLPQPRPVAQFVALIALFPAVLILRGVLDRPIFPLLNALVVLWFVERLRALLAPLPHAPHLLFMLEMIGVIALLAWWIRPVRLIDIPSEVARSRFFRVLGVGVRVALGACVLALCAEVIGYSALGELIGEGVMLAAYAGVVLYGAIRVLDGLVAFALRVRPLRLLGMVRNNRRLIRSRTMTVLRAGAILWWTSELLSRLEIGDEVWAGLVAIFTASLSFGEASISLGDLVAFGLTIWASFLLSRFIKFMLQEDVYTRISLRKGMPYAVSTLSHYVVLTVGFFLAILALGVDLNRFSLLAGAFGVGIGFGLQNVVNNFVSGVILLTERPVEVGDTVALGDVFGEVQRIGIRSSTVRTWQGAEVIVPNGDFVSEQVINWTHSDRRRRLEIPVGVAYGSNPSRVMTILLDAMKANPDVLEDPEPYVLFKGFGDSSLDFEARAWTDEFDFFQRVRSTTCVDFEAALRRAGIVIPFPQRDLHIHAVQPGASKPSRSSAAKAGDDEAPEHPPLPDPGTVPDSNA